MLTLRMLRQLHTYSISITDQPTPTVLRYIPPSSSYENATAVVEEPDGDLPAFYISPWGPRHTAWIARRRASRAGKLSIPRAVDDHRKWASVGPVARFRQTSVCWISFELLFSFPSCSSSQIS